MGNICSTSTLHEPFEIKIEENNQDRLAQPSEKLRNIIKTYKEKNEKIRKELESVENKDADILLQADQNERLRKDLAELKHLMEEKDRVLVKHQLEAALHSRATSVVTSETFSKLLKAGTLAKFGRSGRTKPKEKWVEVHFHSAQTTPMGLIRGCLMLTWADHKSAKRSKRCKILRVKESAIGVMTKIEGVMPKIESKAFSLDVISADGGNDLIFLCQDSQSRKDWIKALNDGFEMAEEESIALKRTEHSIFFNLWISKPKSGIRLEENAIKTRSALDEKMTWSPHQAEIIKGEHVQNQENGAEGDDTDSPCELVVARIDDESLLKTALSIGCVVWAVNGIKIRGLPYSQQFDSFRNTKKPFRATFLKRKYEQPTAFPGILEELIADENNIVKSAFYDIVKGTEFGSELEKSENKTATIKELLTNQQRLTTVLLNTEREEP